MQPKIITKENGHYAIDGELNNQTVPDLSKELTSIISSIQAGSISIDLSLVSRSDSAGVALLVDVMQLAKNANLTLLFSHLPQQMQDIAGLSGLLDILPISQN